MIRERPCCPRSTRRITPETVFTGLRNYTGGELALQELSRREPNVKNRVTAEVKEAVVRVAVEQLAWGQVRCPTN